MVGAFWGSFLRQTYAMLETHGTWVVCATPLAAPRPWPSINTDETHSLCPPRTWAGLFLLRPFYSVINIFFNVQPW